MRAADPDRAAEAAAAETPAPIAKSEIVASALYTREETATLLCLYGKRGAQTVSEIPEDLLPKTPVGPKGGRVGYRGFDILRYLDGCRQINGRSAPALPADYLQRSA
jgi:hypothetical protein